MTRDEHAQMAANAILDQLSFFLDAQSITELQLAYAIRPSITVCCTVNDIIKEYNSTQTNEDNVSKLLERFLMIYFSPTEI